MAEAHGAQPADQSGPPPEEDGGYYARVPGLPGCTANGETPEEAVREAIVAQLGWLVVARKRGQPIPEPSTPERQNA